MKQSTKDTIGAIVLTILFVGGALCVFGAFVVTLKNAQRTIAIEKHLQTLTPYSCPPCKKVNCKKQIKRKLEDKVKRKVRSKIKKFIGGNKDE